MRCLLASSKSKERIAGTVGVVSVPLGTRAAVSGGIVDGCSVETLTFLGDFAFGGESKAALRFCLLTEGVSRVTGASPAAERVVGILVDTIMLRRRDGKRLIYWAPNEGVASASISTYRLRLRSA